MADQTIGIWRRCKIADKLPSSQTDQVLIKFELSTVFPSQEQAL